MEAEQIAKTLMDAVDDISTMKFLLVAGIPTVIIEDHNEAFYPMQVLNSRLGMRNATSLNIDGHNDMSDDFVVHLPKPLPDDYSTTLSVSNHNCAAAHYGFLSRIFWCNPQGQGDHMYYLGSRYNTHGDIHLRTKLERMVCFDGTKTKLVKWAHKNLDGKGFIEQENRRKLVSADEIDTPLKQPFYLNVELDAFCCHRPVDFVRSTFVSYHSIIYEPDDSWQVMGYKARILGTMHKIEQLKRRGIKKPDLLIICRAQGAQKRTRDDAYVPQHMVDMVQEEFIKGVTKLYQDAPSAFLPACGIAVLGLWLPAGLPPSYL